MISLRITKDNVELISKDIVHKGEYKVNTIFFEFDEEYLDLTNKAIFSGMYDSYEMAIIDNKCEIPSEVLKEKMEIVIGVYGYKIENGELVKRYSPTPIKLVIENGSYDSEASSSQEITPTEFEQYTQALNEGLKKIDLALEDLQYKLDSGEFKGEKGDKGDKGDKGADGIDGINGKDGIDGINGTDGKNATINGLEAINIYGGDSISLVQQGNDFYISYNGTEMSIEIVEELPVEGLPNKIYLVLKEQGTESDIYDEYLFINCIWEHIGSTAIDLSNYYTKEETDRLIENNNTNIIGDLNSLETENKENVVSALNEVFNLASESGGQAITYVMSNSSTNPLMLDEATPGIYQFATGNPYVQKDATKPAFSLNIADARLYILQTVSADTPNDTALATYIDSYDFLGDMGRIMTLKTTTSNNWGLINSRTDVKNIKQFMFTAGNQDVFGIKTFKTLPETRVVPTNNYQLVNKLYVDTQIANIDVSLPIASTDVLGGIKVGNSLEISEDGILNTKIIKVDENFSVGLPYPSLFKEYKESGVYVVVDNANNYGILLVIKYSSTTTYQHFLNINSMYGTAWYTRTNGNSWNYKGNIYSNSSIIDNSAAVGKMDAVNSLAIIGWTGNKKNLTTTNKKDFVNAINELKTNIDTINTNLGTVNETLATLTTISEGE